LALAGQAIMGALSTEVLMDYTKGSGADPLSPLPPALQKAVEFKQMVRTAPHFH